MARDVDLNVLHGMLMCSLNESLHIAKYCIDTQKEQIRDFVNEKGCFGFPAAILLLCITDTIGSMFRGTDEQFAIGNKKKSIDDRGKQHFYILNSRFYNQQLSAPVIKDIYRCYRCLLVHNSSLSQGHFLTIGSEADSPFVCGTDKKGKQYVARLNLLSYHKISQKAVTDFLCYFRESSTRFEKSDVLVDIKKKAAMTQALESLPITASGAITPIVTKLE